MESLWYSEKTNLFNLLCPHKFKDYKQQKHNINEYKTKDYVYFENDAAKKVYLIAKGKIKIGYFNEEGDEVVKAILSKGEIFGEKAIYGIEERNEFAQVIEKNTAVCPVDCETLHNLMRENRSFSLRVYKILGGRIKKLERHLKVLLFKDTKTRLIEFLQELDEDYGCCCPKTGNKIIKHPYTQKDIATLIATSRPTLNILMNELRQDNFLDFTRKEIVLKSNQWQQKIL